MLDTMQARDILISKGVTPSRPRLAILHYLLEHYTHPTADEIFRDLRDSVPTLSLTTVYNTLKLFSELGLCVSLSINEKQACYDGHTHPHGHLLCSSCGKVYDIPQEDSPLKFDSEYLHGHKVSEVHYYYKGICSNCLSKSEENN